MAELPIFALRALAHGEAAKLAVLGGEPRGPASTKEYRRISSLISFHLPTAAADNDFPSSFPDHNRKTIYACVKTLHCSMPNEEQKKENPIKHMQK